MMRLTTGGDVSVGNWPFNIAQIIFGGFLLTAGLANQLTPRDEEFGPPSDQAKRAAASDLAYLGTDQDTSFGMRRLSTVEWLVRVKEARAENVKTVAGEAVEALKRHLAEQPTDGFGWLALAQFHQIHGGFDEDVEPALRMSYYTARHEFYVMMQRVGFALRLFPILPDELQQEIRWEVAALVSSSDWHNTRDVARIAMLAGHDGLEIAREEAHRASDYMGQIFDQTVEQETKLRSSKP